MKTGDAIQNVIYFKFREVASDDTLVKIHLIKTTSGCSPYNEIDNIVMGIIFPIYNDVDDNYVFTVL